ncbi:uncharacterized protein LOC143183504 [Calliopsis andreniformis]|uniref:uncharacterized protein LOC143183504 n=1 Tax=Calliopsis andreniformis TaxID=337506 RepID=UPI003FCD46D6
MLGYRLKNIRKDETTLVKGCARHHEHIYRFATMVNNSFEIIIFLQFLVSTSILCFNFYRFMQTEFNARLMEAVLYAICTLTQIFYYCWHGNEVEMKSLEIPDNIIESNWISLNNNSRRILLMIMRRATRPIKFTSTHVVSMNLDSFKIILKTSYSVFNLLQNGLHTLCIAAITISFFFHLIFSVNLQRVISFHENIERRLYSGITESRALDMFGKVEEKPILYNRRQVKVICKHTNRKSVFIKSTMQLLQRVCILLTICGCSAPSSWTSPFKKILYKIYSIFVFLTIHTLCIFQILDLVLIVDNQDDFSDNFYVTLGVFVTCIKMCNLLFTRRNIMLMIGTLQKEPFSPQDIEEMEIQIRYHKITDHDWKRNSCIFTDGIRLLMKLTYRAWLPYDYTSILAFSLTYVHQLMASIVITLSTVACDSLFSGLLIHIHCQFEIFAYRLQNVEEDGNDLVKQCARHHSDIYKLKIYGVILYDKIRHKSEAITLRSFRYIEFSSYFIPYSHFLNFLLAIVEHKLVFFSFYILCRFAKMVNEEFKIIMLLQFLTSTSTICLDLYHVTETNVDEKLLDIVFYASCTLMQIFYYCWYGNEVKLKSLEVTDKIFASNWILFSNSSMKILLTMLRRAMEPIEFTSGYLVTIDLESFKAVRTKHILLHLICFNKLNSDTMNLKKAKEKKLQQEVNTKNLKIIIEIVHIIEILQGPVNYLLKLRKRCLVDCQNKISLNKFPGPPPTVYELNRPQNTEATLCPMRRFVPPFEHLKQERHIARTGREIKKHMSRQIYREQFPSVKRMRKSLRNNYRPLNIMKFERGCKRVIGIRYAYGSNGKIVRNKERQAFKNSSSSSLFEMRKLSLSFALLTYSGYWRPIEWPVHSLRYWLYNIYSAFMILLLYSFAFCGLIDSLTSKDLETTTDKFSLFISVLGVCFKVANLFLQRDQIINVINSLLTENCKPRNNQEAAIQKRFDNYARKLTIYCEILNESAASFATVAQFDKFIRTRTLPVSNWVPYDLSSKKVFITSLLHQTFGLMICANASVANETLIAGLMIQAGAQFEIFCHRARDLPVLLMEAERDSTSMEDLRRKKNRIFRNLINYHLEVYNFARIVNSVFQYMMFLQFSISSTVLCLTIYKISTANSLDIKVLWDLSYLCCMLMQVYLYCWFGNEVTLKSEKVCEAIYGMDWTVLPANMMKNLLMIMARSKRPVRMTSGHIVTLSTDSFMTIMKITYSSYNILKDSSNK